MTCYIEVRPECKADYGYSFNPSTVLSQRHESGMYNIFPCLKKKMLGAVQSLLILTESRGTACRILITDM